MATTSTPHDACGPTGADAFRSIGEWIQCQVVETGTPSMAVAVARNGKIVYEEGFGWADRENRIVATPHTLYSLASISKPITATGLMVLKERGKIDLDRPVNDYLGDVQVRARAGDVGDASVRRVANHSAGLPLHYHFFFSDEPRPVPPMAETIRRYGNLVTAPGERYHYSNLGYGILSHVISRVSGKTYAEFMRQEVFHPLGMTHASVGIAPGLEGYQAVRYGPDGLPLPFYDFDHAGASAVFCSAHDLARFGMFHLKAHVRDQKAILPDEAIDDMQRPTVSCGEGAGYGVGWRITEDEMGYRSISHSGGMGGVSTRLALLPSEGVAVATLANASSQLPGRAAEEVLSVLLPDYARDRARRDRDGKEKEPGPQAPSGLPVSELSGRWTGKLHTCNGETPITLWFQDDGDVHVRLGDQMEALLSDVAFDGGRLSGCMAGDIGTEDADRRPHVLGVDMTLRGTVLNGCITSASEGPRGYALSHWVEVRKDASE